MTILCCWLVQSINDQLQMHICVCFSACVQAVKYYSTSNALCIILAAPSLPIESYAASLDTPESPC